MRKYKLYRPIDPSDVTLSKYCMWDTLSFDWRDMVLRLNGDRVDLPQTITVPFKHKIKTRHIWHNDTLDLQFMLKQGTQWHTLQPATTPNALDTESF